VRWWHRRLFRALELRVRVTGDFAERALLVANHIAWLDIPVIGAQGQIAFLSKAEARAWPLIGWMAETAGTLFITRGANEVGDLDRRRIAERCRTAIADALAIDPTAINGVANTMGLLIRGLERHGHQVHLVRPRQPGETPGIGGRETLVPGIPVPGYRGLRVGLPVARRLRYVWERSGPDICYIATPLPQDRSFTRS
jgi:hypothetical protein